MTREEMLTEVIKVKGFENKWTVWFAGLTENKMFTNNTLEKIMIAVVKMPFEEEED